MMTTSILFIRANLTKAYSRLYAVIGSANGAEEPVAAFQNLSNRLVRDLPSGTILIWGGALDRIPEGYLPCDGRALSRATYGPLFAKLGVIFGASDGNSAF